MNNALLVAERELRAYARSPLGYIVAAVALLIEGIYFYAFGLGAKTALLSAQVLAVFFEGASGATIIVAALLAMRLLAGEKETGTLVLLNTAPIREREVVLGKFLAGLAFLTLLALLTAYMPALIFVNGKVSIGHILVGYLGVVLLAAAALAVSLFGSAIAPNQVVAALVSGALLGTLFLIFFVAPATDSAAQRLPLGAVDLPRAAAVVHDRRAQAGERGLQRGRRVLLPARGHQDAGGAAMALNDKDKAASPAAYGAWLLPAYLGALVLVFVGERIVTSDGARYALSGIGVLGLAITTAARWTLAGKGSDERRRAERALAMASAGGLLAIALYFTTTDRGKAILGVAAMKPDTRARIEGATTVGWVALLLISLLPLIMGEMALAPMRRAAMIEARRVRAAIASGLTLAFALAYTALFTYAAGELDAKVDFSYFRTARPSESTKNIAASASDPIKIRAFFPQLNDVGTEAMGYLREVAAAAPKLEIEEHDRLLVPAIAKESKVTSDGVIVLSRGPSRETLTIGTEMKSAAGKLKTLDGDFQKALLKVLREAHVAYLTIGHGELNEGKSEGAEGRTAKSLRKLLESQNYTVKDLGLTQGLGTDVPADATMVAVVGPSSALLPEEVASLKRYAERGGHLLLALDPDAKVDLSPLAEMVGLRWSPTRLAHEKMMVARRHNKSDRGILVTNRYSSHASVSTLSRNSARAPTIYPGASSLDKADGAGDFKIDFAVKALADTFEDSNDNYEFDQGEKKNAYNLVAAVSKSVPPPAGYKGKDPPELRAFVLADADAISDAAFGHEPNIFLLADALRWLGGEESWSGAITNTEDVRIEHTKQKDVIRFYATILGAPGVVLGLGLVLARRPRRARKSDAAKAEAAKEEKSA
ncbi:MAG: Gldg family protein [Minicystis sp.]